MIKGKIVGLRAIEKNDLQLLKDWRNIEKFRRNFREIRELNLSHQEYWYQKVCVESKNDFMFIIERLDDHVPIGVCGLTYVNWIIRSADFSFYIGFEEKYIDDRGYAEEGARLLIDYGFRTLNLNKIWMELYEFDDAKINFFQTKFNFKQDGKLRQNAFDGGKYWDSIIISKLKEDLPDK